MNTLQQIPAAKSAGTTAIQLELVATIRRLTAAADGLPPTVRELSAATGTRCGDVQQKLNRLRRDGVVTWKQGKARTLRVIGGATCPPT
jgi:SOS-response transcriptional repressor LexA